MLANRFDFVLFLFFVVSTSSCTSMTFPLCLDGEERPFFAVFCSSTSTSSSDMSRAIGCLRPLDLDGDALAEAVLLRPRESRPYQLKLFRQQSRGNRMRTIGAGVEVVCRSGLLRRRASRTADNSLAGF